MSRTQLHAAASIAAILVAMSLAAFARGDDPPTTPAEGFTQVTTVEPAAEAAVSLLEDERATGDEMPEDVAEQVDEKPAFGMNPDLSRLAIGNLTSSVYVVPADDHVCATLTGGDGATMMCPTTDEIADGEAGPGTTIVDGGGIAIWGLVPDGVESVDVQTGVSDSDEVETEDNAYYYVVPAETVLRTVSYTGPSGEVEFPIKDPSLAFEE